MIEITQDILEAAQIVNKDIEYYVDDDEWQTNIINGIARAILAERERCADVARRYLEDIAGCNMNEDEPEKIAAAVMDPKWGPPLL